MRYQLLVLDIDGTVTNTEKKVLERTREAVIRLQEQGIHVVLASGRPPEGVYPVARTLELERFSSYILAFNGARIIDVGSRRCVFEKTLPRHIPGRLLEDALKNQVGVAVYQPGVIVAGTMPDCYMKRESAVSKMPLRYCPEFMKKPNNPVNECLITGAPDILDVLEPAFSHKYFHEVEVYHSEPFYLEVVPKNVDKAYGLKHLLRLLGITKEEMVCCGDSYNDIRMLQCAGVGVAMANAEEAVKAVADYTTERDNDHDGIVEVIEKFFN